MKGERGNILILGLVLWLVACLLLFGTISAALLALERRELLASSDSLALSIADDLNEASYYAGESEFAPTSAQVRERARQLLGEPGHGGSAAAILIEPTGVEGGAVVVTLRREADLAFVPSGSNFSTITLEVTSRAQLRERPIR
ncbi:hypothetical protein VR010_02780 [Actinomycetaceae bacterium L2_0104]